MATGIEQSVGNSYKFLETWRAVSEEETKANEKCYVL